MKPEDVPQKLIEAAQQADLDNRPNGVVPWRRVPDWQVANLLAGALTARGNR